MLHTPHKHRAAQTKRQRHAAAMLVLLAFAVVLLAFASVSPILHRASKDVSRITGNPVASGTVSFTILVSGPRIYSPSPSNNSVDASVSTTIQFYLVDASSDIDNETIALIVDGENATPTMVLARNTDRNYTISYTPPVSFANGQSIGVSVNSTNAGGVRIVDSFSFTTVAAGVGGGGAGGGGGGGGANGPPRAPPGPPRREDREWFPSNFFPSEPTPPETLPETPEIPPFEEVPLPVTIRTIRVPTYLPIIVLIGFAALVAVTLSYSFAIDGFTRGAGAMIARIAGLFRPTNAADDHTAERIISSRKLKSYTNLYVSSRIAARYPQFKNLRTPPQDSSATRTVALIAKRYRISNADAELLHFLAGRRFARFMTVRPIPQEMAHRFRHVRFRDPRKRGAR